LLGTRELTGFLCAYDIGKRAAEIKLVLGTTDGELPTILDFNQRFMRYLFIPGPRE